MSIEVLAAMINDRRFGGGRRRPPAGAAIMSALQQSPICGLEEPEFPYRGEARQGHRAAGQGPPNRWRYPVVSCRGGSRKLQVLRAG
jgi:hypothetical protein